MMAHGFDGIVWFSSANMICFLCCIFIIGKADYSFIQCGDIHENTCKFEVQR